MSYRCMVLAGLFTDINVPGTQKLCVNRLGFLLPEAVNIVDQPNVWLTTDAGKSFAERKAS